MAHKPISIEEEMKVSYLDYAMSVIIGRALPDVRDGLKPVQRRILYAMFREGLTPGKKYSKCAGVVGEVLKKYHPHGDSAVYDALVRMAQDFNLRHPLIDGQGNFGSIDGDPAAAYRYTEARMAKIAEELLADIDRDTVDFVTNFDETTKEPTVLPSKVPTLLLNGASGIAVGMATNIPPHNLDEVVGALLHMLDNPKATVEDLMQFIKGPDFPTGGLIYGRDGILSAYKTGRGLVTMRAKTHVERHHRGQDIIVVTEIPFQVNKSSLIKKIAELVRQKKIEGISELRDESDRDGIRIVIEVKRGEFPQVVLNNLFKHTQMQSTFGINTLALVGNQPHMLSLRRMLAYFLYHRRDVIIRRTKFMIRKAKEKLHLLEGFKIALDHLDEVIELIKASASPADAKAALIKSYDFSETQAQAILEMKLQRLTGLERDKIIQDYTNTVKEIKELKNILKERDVQTGIIKTELTEIREKYANPRRTEISDAGTDISIEDLITEEEMVITISHNGYIKRNALSTYRSQHRGGKGLKGMETREEDYVDRLFIGSTHDYMLFFTNRGKLFWMKIYQIPEAGRTARGKAIVNLLKLEEGEQCTTALPIKSFEEGFLVFFTRNGIVKKTPLKDYSNPRSSGIIALKVRDDDELIAVRTTNGTNDLVMGTRNGLAIKFNENDVRSMGRTAGGVIGIRLRSGDYVVSADVAKNNTSLLTITEKGLGKRTKIEGYPIRKRGGMGVISIKTTDKGGKAVGLIQVSDEDEVVIMANSGKLIRTKAGMISQTGRNTQGVKLMDVTRGDRVVSFGRVAEKD